MRKRNLVRMRQGHGGERDVDNGLFLRHRFLPADNFAQGVGTVVMP